jgi:AcrR family transcriptional regulator
MSSETAPQTRRSRRRERTHQALKDAATAIITEKGVAGLRLQEITDRADLALGSFYNYFDTKEDLVEAVVADSVSTLADRLAMPASDEQDPAELVGNAVRRFVGLAHETPDFARLVVQLDQTRSLAAAAVHPAALRALQRGADSGRFDVENLAVAVTGIVGGAIALMRGILDGAIHPDADVQYARASLRSLGVQDLPHNLGTAP